MASSSAKKQIVTDDEPGREGSATALNGEKRDLTIKLILAGRSTAEIVGESQVSRFKVQRLRRQLHGEGSSEEGKRAAMDVLIERVEAFSRCYMDRYDASHNFQHIQRVLGLAKRIEASQKQELPTLEIDGDVVTLACLMHDVGDKKYLELGQDGSTMAATQLEMLGAEPWLARKVQAIVNHVSYSNEVKNPQQVLAVLAEHPELGIVQDADRLDAMGAVGIGRTFTYNAARGHPTSMDDPVNHIDEKLLKLSDMMKTPAGKAMAAERETRLRLFYDWWREEVGMTAGSS